MKYLSAEDLYSKLDTVWPDNNSWYDYTQKKIEQFIYKNLSGHMNDSDIYLNAGSGGRVYNLPGTCYHIDIVSNLLNGINNAFIGSIEKMPFDSEMFDSLICVGSVINYCDPFLAIKELSRVIKPQGYMVLEFERSNTAELWLKKDYGRKSSMQHYEYLNQTHTLWIYAEKYIKKILCNFSLQVIKQTRFHNISALVNRITNNEEVSGHWACFDKLSSPFSYYMAHNIILFCKKN